MLLKYKKISTKEKKHILPIKPSIKVIIFFKSAVKEIVYIVPSAETEATKFFLGAFMI